MWRHRISRTQFIMHKSVVADPCSMYLGAYPHLSLLVDMHLVRLYQLQCMDPAKGCQLSFILCALVSFEYQIANAKRPTTYTLAMIFPKGLLIFLYSKCGYIMLLFKEFKVGITTVSLLFFREHRYSGLV